MSQRPVVAGQHLCEQIIVDSKSRNMTAVKMLRVRGEIFPQPEARIDAAGGLVKALTQAAKPEDKAKIYSEASLHRFSENVRLVHRGVDRWVQMHRNLSLAIALERYQRKHGQYPKDLASLAPKNMPAVPDDLFTGAGLIYRPSEKGYLLYSFGPNGVDDQGRGLDDEPKGGDDLAIRMPLSKLK